MASIKQLKMKLKRTEEAFDMAFAEAFKKAPTTISQLYGIPPANAIKDKKLMEQIALTDSLVKDLFSKKSNLIDQIIELENIEAEIDKDRMEKQITVKEIGEACLKDIVMKSYNCTAFSLYQDIEKKLTEVLEVIFKIRSELNEKTEWDSSFFTDRLWKDSLLKKTDITSDLKMLYDIMQEIPDYEKEANVLVKNLINYAKDIREDAKDLMKFAHINLSFV